MVQKLVFGAFNLTPSGTTEGIEPWVTDGTAAGTFLLKDINAGSSGSNPTSFFSVNGKVVFYATTPANGSELWVTDGTTNGTVLLADINPGSASAGVNALNFTLLGDKLLFTANNPATGIELWVTDGTSAGTQILRDIAPGPGNGNAQSKPLAVIGNTAIFAAEGDVWSTDGTPDGTVKLYDFESTPGQPSGVFSDSLFQANGLVYFNAFTVSPEGRTQSEVWVTDGTASGTREISNFGPETNVGVAASLGTLGGTTYFVAQVTELDGTTLGLELYASTGSSLELFGEFDPGFASGNINPDPTRVAIAGNQLFFTREIPASGTPTELWVIDGATGGTQLLETFTNITGPRIAVFGDSIVFTASTTVGGVTSSFAPWISDGTVGGTLQLLASNPTSGGNSPDAGNYTAFAGKLFFTANGGPATGKELWVTDGTPAGTVLFKDLFPGISASNPSDFRVVGDKLFFQATTASGREYWVTDGTSEGTVLVSDIAGGSVGSVGPAGPFGSAILDDAAAVAPTYAISGTPTAAEGGELTFTVTRDIGTAAGSVALALGGTATSGADYTAPGLSVSFAAGETSKTVTITTLTDATVEPDETVTLALGAVTGGGTVSAASGTATGTITDAHISLTQIGLAYAQDFDSLQPVGTSASLPFGWTLKETGTNANGLYTANAGQTNAGDSYSFGAAASGDRALGSIQSGSLSSVFGASFVNDTAMTITQLEIAFRGEQWRLGTADRLDSLKFEYSLDATAIDNGSWQSVAALDFRTVDSSGTVGARDGNSAANGIFITSTIDALSIGAGSTFFIRWTDTDAAGADDGLAVDDFSLTPKVLLPPIYAVTDSPTAAEGGALTFTVTRDNGAMAGSVSFSLGGTATGGADYTTPTQTVSFAAGETSRTVTIATLTDAIADPNETVTLTLGAVTGGGTVSAANGTATGTITDVPSVVAVDDSFATITGVPLTFTADALLGNDKGAQSIAGVSLFSLNGGTVSFEDGVYTYRNSGNFTGIDSFTYNAQGASGVQDEATVRITVTPDPVNAVDDNFTTVAGVRLTIPVADLLANDTAAFGVVDATTFTAGGGTVVIQNGTALYIPGTGFTGVDTFTYSAVGVGGTREEATVVITVTPSGNAPPVGVTDRYATTYQQTLNIPVADGVLDNDTDPDDDALRVVGVLTDVAHGTLALNTDGSFAYTPDAGFYGADSFVYTLEDSSGLQSSATVTIDVEVPDFNVVAGSNRLFQSLRGTDDMDVLLMGSARLATMRGGTGADVFVFGETDNNRRSESALVRDYEIGVDAIDLAGATIARIIEIGNSVTLVLEGRGRDTLTILGVDDADQLTFTDVWSSGQQFV